MTFLSIWLDKYLKNKTATIIFIILVTSCLNLRKVNKSSTVVPLELMSFSYHLKFLEILVHIIEIKFSFNFIFSNFIPLPYIFESH